MGNKRNYFVYDTETSGLDPEQGHEIVQIAARALNGWNFDDHHAGKFHILIKPQNPEKADPKALEVIGPLWDKALKQGVEPSVAYQSLFNWIVKTNDSGKVFTKSVLVGHNADYDDMMTTYFFKKYKLVKNRDDKPWFKIFDSWQTMMELWESDPNVNKFNLDAYLALLGIQRSGNHHDAMEDVDLLTEAFRRTMKFMRRCNKSLRIATTTELAELDKSEKK